MTPLYIRCMDRLYLACIWFSGLAIFLMSIIIPWGVFMRYVLGTGSRWPEPIAILLMMVFTFIGAAAGYRANAHIAVGLITDHVPEAARAVLGRIVDLLMVVACVFLAGYGARLSIETMGQSIAELPWLPVGVTYLSLPLGALATLLFVIERLVWGPQEGRGIVSGEAKEPALATVPEATAGAR